MGMPKIIGGITYGLNDSPVVKIPSIIDMDEHSVHPRRISTIEVITPEETSTETPTTTVSQDVLPAITPITITMPSAPVDTTATNSIVKQVAKTPIGKHVFKHKNMNIGNMQALLDEAAKYGISFRVTSGARPGAKTKQGKTSHHAAGNAIDITPIPGETYADLRNKIRNSPEFVKWMQDHGYGIYDETTPEVMAKTGASGAHWHIGPDRVAIEGLKRMLA